MAKVDKRIRDPKIHELINNILTAYKDNNQTFVPSIIEDMQALRLRFIEHSQPTIVKSIRLAYEHIEKFGKFEIDYTNEDFDMEEEEYDEEGNLIEKPEPLVKPEPAEKVELPVPIFEYYIGLLANPTNKYNRDEIKEINILLKESLEA